jgi:endo-1,4-beta-xylanase
VGDLSVPDPRVTNPELFDLQKPEAPIPQFVNAMNMGGINLTPEQVTNEITYQTLKNKDGNPFVIAAFNLDADPNQTGEPLEGPTPLLIATKDEMGEWEWSKTSLRNLMAKLNPDFLIGATAHYPIYGDEFNRTNLPEFLASEFDSLILENHLRWNGVEKKPGTIDQIRISQVRKLVEFATNNGQTIVGQHLFFFEEYPDWLTTGTFTREQLQEIIQRRANIVKSFPEINVWVVANEFHPISLGWHEDYLQKQLGTKKSILMMFQAVQKANPEATLLISDSYNETRNGVNYQNIRDMVAYLRQNGIKNIGVGLHFHRNGASPLNPEEVSTTIRSYGDDVPVYILEADVNMKDIPPQIEGRDNIQAKEFANGIKACLMAPNCRGFFIWDPGDSASWLERPEIGAWYSPHADATPFSDDFSPKSSYYAILREIINHLALSNNK